MVVLFSDDCKDFFEKGLIDDSRELFVVEIK